MSLHPIRSGRNTRRRKAAWRSFRTQQQWKPWKGWTVSEVEKKGLGLFGQKKFVLGLVLLAVIIGGGAMYADPNNQFFHKFEANPAYHLVDPTTYLWQATAPKNDLSEFRTTHVTFSALFGHNALGMAPNATATAVALTKQSYDFSSVSSKELESFINFGAAGGGCCGTDQPWGMYFTTNGTLPTQLGYDPYSDPSVALLAWVRDPTGSPTTSRLTLFLQRQVGVSIGSVDVGGKCSPSSDCFIDSTVTLNNPTVSADIINWYANFTGNAPGPGGVTTCPGGLGNGCSDYGPSGTTNTTPFLKFNGIQFYIGFYQIFGSQAFSTFFFFDAGNCAGAGPCAGGTTTCASTNQCMQMDMWFPTVAASPPPPSPQTDTGGWFGQVGNILNGAWNALVGAGSNVFNAIAQNPITQGILGAFEQAFLWVGQQLLNGLNLLEQFVVTVLNAIGNVLGWGNIGSDLQTLITNLITFLTDPTNGLPFWITQVPAYMSRFFNWITLGATWVPPSLTLAQNAINVALVGFTQAITILSVGLQFFAASSAFLMIFSYFLYVGDDALTGVLDWAGTIERLMFSLINIIFDVVNVSLDFIGVIVSIIPKPFIQSSFSRIPRLPSLNVGGAGVAWPRLDFAEALSGNLITYFFWIIGFYMSAWYESRNPCLVGSLCALIPSTASNMQLLATLLPVIQVFVFFSGGLCMFWLVNRPLTVIGLPEFLEEAGLGVGPGRAPRTSLAGVGVKAGVKHFGPKAFGVQARLEKASGRTSFKALGPFATGGHIEKGIGTKEAVSPGALFD